MILSHSFHLYRQSRCGKQCTHNNLMDCTFSDKLNPTQLGMVLAFVLHQNKYIDLQPLRTSDRIIQTTMPRVGVSYKQLCVLLVPTASIAIQLVSMSNYPIHWNFFKNKQKFIVFNNFNYIFMITI